MREALIAVTDLVRARRSGGIPLLLAEFLDYRPETRNETALEIHEHVPSQLQVTGSVVWLEQLLTSQSFAAAFGFWGPERETASGHSPPTAELAKTINRKFVTRNLS